MTSARRRNPARRLAVLAGALAAALAGTVIAGPAPVHADAPAAPATRADDPWSQWRNMGNGLCMTTAADPANGFQGTATFAACDAGDRRQQWTFELRTHNGFRIVSRDNGKCLTDIGGWGLAWLGPCDENDLNQAWRLSLNGAGDANWLSWDDEKRLSTPYAAGTSYVTARRDLDPADLRYRWRFVRP